MSWNSHGNSISNLSGHPDNVCSIIRQRELNGKQEERKIVRNLLACNKRVYKRTWKQQVTGGFHYDGNVYLSNYRLWFHGCYKNNVPCFTKTERLLPDTGGRSRRIKQVLRYQCPVTELNDVSGLNDGSYDECLFALTSDSYLIQYILHEKWVLRHNVCLSRDYEKIFEYLSYDEDYVRIVIKSKLNPHGIASDINIYFALFLAAPFKFIGMFKITKKLFGKIKDAYITDGLLAIFSKNVCTYYSMEYILNNFLEKDFNIGDIISSSNLLFGLDTVGSPPYGLPLNINITHTPPCLYKLTVVQGLSLGGYPWQYIVNEDKNCSTVNLYRLSDKQYIGSVKPQNLINGTLEENQTYFHSDNSGRILSVDHNQIRFVSIVQILFFYETL